MISLGRNIQSAQDELTASTVEDLYLSLVFPESELSSKIRQLRIIKNIDKKQYSIQKRNLPYFVCAVFNPKYRAIKNFAYTEYFVIDIDNISEKGIDINALKDELKSDERIMLMFVSPSEDGIKILFKLKERCYDAGIFSLFYKKFLIKFSNQYNLEQVVDAKTSDVSRACFLSIDGDAYFNKDSGCVDINDYIEPDNPLDFYEQNNAVKKEIEDIKAKSANVHLDNDKDEHDPNPDASTMENIKKLLNPKLLKKQEKPMPYVPEVLNEIMENLVNYIQSTGVIVSSINDISYGKQIHFKMGIKQAEVNLFYGKKGFKTIASTRTGTDEELNILMVDLVESFLIQL